MNERNTGSKTQSSGDFTSNCQDRLEFVAPMLRKCRTSERRETSFNFIHSFVRTRKQLPEKLVSTSVNLKLSSRALRPI